MVYTTINNLETAESLCKKILETRLAACANIFPSGIALYHWEGKLERSEEVFILFKTTEEKMAILTNFITNHHPYSLPAILSFKAGASDDFFKYIKSSTLI